MPAPRLERGGHNKILPALAERNSREYAVHRASLEVGEVPLMPVDPLKHLMILADQIERFASVVAVSKPIS